MPDSLIVVAFWAVLLAVAIPYVLRAKHPAQKPVAAVTIFILVFSIVAGLVFGALAAVLTALEAGPILGETWAAALFLLAVFGPAALLARWQIRKPPRKSPPVP